MAKHDSAERSKQEEIREGVAKIIFENRSITSSAMPITGKVMKYLHSQGVVLKVDREFPTESGGGMRIVTTYESLLNKPPEPQHTYGMPNYQYGYNWSQGSGRGR